MLSNLYFAYGSNLSLSQMQDRCKMSVPITPAVLKGYKLTFKHNKRGNGVADIVKEDGSEVLGALYAVSKSDVKSLDKFEGHPHVYVRQQVEVQANGEQVNVITYIMRDEFKPGVPKQEYLQRILRGYRDWHLPVNNVIKEVKYIKKEAIKK